MISFRYILFLIIIVFSPNFAQDAKLSALGFFEYSFTAEDDQDISNEFEFHRVYLTFEKKMSDALSYKFQSDIGRKSDDKRLELYLKTAQVDWNTEYGKFVIGLQSTNLFKVQEKTWGYRSIDKSPMDKYKFGSSSVMGLGYYNHFEDINYSILVSNGAGYKNPEDDSYKKLLASVFYGQSKLNLKDGINGGAVLSFEPYGSEDNSNANLIVAGVFGGWAMEPIRFGVEYEREIDSENTNPIAILSAYGNYKMNDIIDIYGRIDSISKDSSTNNYIIGGISLSPEKGLKIMPNIRYNKSEDSNASILYNINFEFNIK